MVVVQMESVLLLEVELGLLKLVRQAEMAHRVQVVVQAELLVVVQVAVELLTLEQELVEEVALLRARAVSEAMVHATKSSIQLMERVEVVLAEVIPALAQTAQVAMVEHTVEGEEVCLAV